jgi:glycosyltransferase involved in cell wall biosynthesis
VVDDGSTDETAAVALAHDVWVLRHLINRGQGAAIQTGIDFALGRGAAILVTFDADGQHAAGDVELLLEPIRQGAADIALGSRFLGRAEGMPQGRWLILKLGVVFTRVVSRVRVTDTHNGLRALSAAAARRLRITQDRMAHASEILDEIHRLGLRYREVPVTVRYTAGTLAKGQPSGNALAIAGQILFSRFLR